MIRKKSPLWRAVLLTAAEALILAGAWWGIQHETAAVNQAVNEVSDLRDPSPYRAALLGHLGKIHVALEGYLHSPDPALEKQIAESRRDFEMLIPEFARQNPKLFPAAASEEIKRTFTIFKEVVDHTLEANTRRMDSRGLLDRNFEHILYLIEHNIRPIIRKDQANSAERADAILNIENLTRAWQANLGQAWAQPSQAASALTFENENRGETYLELYSNMELLPRERKIYRDIRALWQQNSDLARESYVKETLVNEAEKIMDAQRLQIIGALNKYLPALPPAEMLAKKQSIMNTMRLHLAATAAFALAGLVTLLLSVIVIYRLVHPRPVVADGVYRAPGASAKQTDARLLMDLKGVITEWGPGAQALYGYAAADIIGQSIGKLFESESEIARLGQELQKAKRATFETTHKTKAGAAIPVRIEFHFDTEGAGHATAITLVCSRR